MEGMGHPSSGGRGNPRKEKQRDDREDIMLWLRVSFPYFPVYNVRTSKAFVGIRPDLCNAFFALRLFINSQPLNI